MMEKRFLIFLMMGAVLQKFGHGQTFRIGIRIYHGRRSRTIRVHLTVPPTKAPATTLTTTDKIGASNGGRRTQGASGYSSSTNIFLSKSTPSTAQVLKTTASKLPTTVIIQEDDDTSAFCNTTQCPPTALSVRNSYVSSDASLNTTRTTPSKTTNVIIIANDNTTNYSKHDESQTRHKTQSDEAGIQKIQEFLQTKGCFAASFDEKSGEIIFESPATAEESLKHNQALNNIETTLMSISITAEIISFAFLSVMRVSKSERIFVHKNLLVSLAFGHTVYILDMNIFPSRKMHLTICSVIAAVQHYLYTSLYTWMLIEGVNLYLKMVKVFSFEKPYVTYTLVGWGLPGVIVGLMAAIQPSTYDMSTILYKNITCGTLKLTGIEDRDRCWLNGSNWKFKGPVLAMLLANLAVFAIVLRISFKRVERTSYVQTTRKGLKAIFALLPLLGVTFLLGFFVHSHVAVEYGFVLLNSIQGVLFLICHCALDDQVRDAMNKILRKKNRVPGLQQFKQEPDKETGMAKKTNELHSATFDTSGQKSANKVCPVMDQ